MKNSKPLSISEAIIDNKEFIFPLLFYLSGLILGAFIFKNEGFLAQIMKELFEFKCGEFIYMLIARLGLYLTIFSLTVILSFCALGFPVIYLIPLVSGVIISLKIAYYYSLSLKGIGYCLALIIPEASLLMTILIFTVKNSYILSKNIYFSATKKPDVMLDFDIKAYLRLFLVYLVFTAFAAVINSAVVFLLGSVIKP